jgi:hypothetical protein
MIYIYENPDSNERVEVIQGMNDEHRYERDGVQWSRVWTIPNTSIDTKIDPFSSRDFLNKTNKKGTIGDLQDRAQELSHMRKDKLGKDPILEKEVAKYKKKYNVAHPSEIKKN